MITWLPRALVCRAWSTPVASVWLPKSARIANCVGWLSASGCSSSHPMRPFSKPSQFRTDVGGAPALPACPASCWCRLRCLPALPGAGASTPSELSPDCRTRTQCAQHARASSFERAPSRRRSTCPTTRTSLSPIARTCGYLLGADASTLCDDVVGAAEPH